MKEKVAGFFKKLWEDEAGASHMVEIILVIVVVLALAGILLTKLSNTMNNKMDEVDQFGYNDIPTVTYVIDADSVA